MRDLKPCPDYRGKIRVIVLLLHGGSQLQCGDCGKVFSLPDCDTALTAIEAWNRSGAGGSPDAPPIEMPTYSDMEIGREK